MNGFLLFYLGSHPDHRGRFLAEILAQDDYWLEVTHDYIQWLFPTREFSRVVPNAPTVNNEIEAAFHDDELLRCHLRASLIRMLSFYGLAYTGNNITKGHNWAARKGNWFDQDTHNNLRITRMIKSMACLGLQPEARALFQCLRGLRNSKYCGIGSTAFDYWEKAAEEASNQ